MILKNNRITQLVVCLCFFLMNLGLVQASTQSDTAASSVQDSTKPKTQRIISESGSLNGPLKYHAQDSIYVNLKTSLAYLYSATRVNYDGLLLEAEYMEMDMQKNEVLAQPLLDSAGEAYGLPHFEQGSDVFDADEIRYNIKTQKGIIKNVMTQQDELYVHGKVIKKYPDDVVHIHNAKFTSCDLEHPHFDIRAFKAKVIPDDKIVIGLGMMFIEDIPTPLVVPFAVLPNNAKRESGLLMPNYGQSRSEGFFFKGLGWYQKLGQYFDIKAETDLYTNGNWEVRALARYAWRYHFAGSLGFGYSQIYAGERGDPERTKRKGISIQWTHYKDSKAHPNINFSANVNYKNSTYTANANNLNDYITNTTASNITYSQSFLNKLHLSINAGSSANTNTRDISINLPTVNFSVSTLYPFKRKKQVGKKRWYESIGFSYRIDAKNEIATKDSLFFKPEMLENMRNGMRQNASLSSTVKILKYINWTNSLNYNEYWYLRNITAEYLPDSNGNLVYTTTNNKGFKTTRDFAYNSNFSFKLYGIFRFRRGKISAFRHVLTPNISFAYHPDFSKPFWGSYGTYVDPNGVERLYSRYSNSIYGGPPQGVVGSVGFSLNNTFDMKIRSGKDSVATEKKVSLLDYFNISTSYNIAADSLRWAPISLSARTVLFRRLNITASANFDFYKVDSNGNRYNEFFWKDNKGKALRFTRTNLNYNFSWNFNPKSTGSSSSSMNSAITNPEITSYANPLYTQSDLFLAPVDFSVSWGLTLSYYGAYTLTPLPLRAVEDKKFRHDITQTINLTGDISITPKWKVSFSTGFDIISRKMTLTSINFSRDLHCWEMGFYWVPFGSRTEWNFHIRIRSSVFQDLKYEKAKDFRDTDYY